MGFNSGFKGLIWRTSVETCCFNKHHNLVVLTVITYEVILRSHNWTNTLQIQRTARRSAVFYLRIEIVSYSDSTRSCHVSEWCEWSTVMARCYVPVFYVHFSFHLTSPFTPWRHIDGGVAPLILNVGITWNWIVSFTLRPHTPEEIPTPPRM